MKIVIQESTRKGKKFKLQTVRKRSISEIQTTRILHSTRTNSEKKTTYQDTEKKTIRFLMLCLQLFSLGTSYGPKKLFQKLSGS